MLYILAPYIVNVLIILVVAGLAWALTQPLMLLGLFFLRDMPYVVPQQGGQDTEEGEESGTPIGFIQ